MANTDRTCQGEAVATAPDTGLSSTRSTEPRNLIEATAVHSSGWCCVDCLFLLANGDTPEGLSPDETAEWLAKIDRRTEGFEVVLGGEHVEDCPNIEDGQWQGTTDCDCEQVTFSSSPCDVCGSQLAGCRHAVAYFEVHPEDPEPEPPTVWQLARLADVADPDTPESPGARWLQQVASLADELNEYYNECEQKDAVTEAADSLVPVYTHERWRVFCDLAAYNEDTSDYGQPADMTEGAGVALYMVAERLLSALVAEESDR